MTAKKFFTQQQPPSHIAVVGDNPKFEKNLPQSPDIESAVLGAILLEKSAAQEYVPKLQAEYFYKESNYYVFQAIQEIHNSQNPSIDLLTVTNKLRAKGNLDKAGGIPTLARLTANINSAAHIEAHIHILHELYLRRKIIQLSDNLLKEAYEGSEDVFAILDDAQKKILALDQKNEKATPIGNALTRLFDVLENFDASKQGVPSGYRDIDRRMNVFEYSDLVILAARPGGGKSAFAINLAINAASQGHQTAMLSAEMSELQISKRFLSVFSGFNPENFKRKLTEEQLAYLAEYAIQLGAMPLYLEQVPAIPLNSLVQKIRSLHKEHNVRFFIVDYLQLIVVPDSERRVHNREQVVSTVVQKLKALAVELNIVVLALSQLSRDCEKRTDKRPNLSDLRESGSIEQEANKVLLLHRPEYYGIMEDENGESLKGLVEVIFAKFRDGEIGSDWLRYSKLAFKDVEYFKEEDNEQTSDKASTPF